MVVYKFEISYLIWRNLHLAKYPEKKRNNKWRVRISFLHGAKVIIIRNRLKQISKEKIHRTLNFKYYFFAGTSWIYNTWLKYMKNWILNIWWHRNQFKVFFKSALAIWSLLERKYSFKLKNISSAWVKYRFIMCIKYFTFMR